MVVDSLRRKEINSFDSLDRSRMILHDWVVVVFYLLVWLLMLMLVDVPHRTTSYVAEEEVVAFSCCCCCLWWIRTISKRCPISNVSVVAPFHHHCFSFLPPHPIGHVSVGLFSTMMDWNDDEDCCYPRIGYVSVVVVVYYSHRLLCCPISYALVVPCFDWMECPRRHAISFVGVVPWRRKMVLFCHRVVVLWPFLAIFLPRRMECCCRVPSSLKPPFVVFVVVVVVFVFVVVVVFLVSLVGR